MFGRRKKQTPSAIKIVRTIESQGPMTSKDLVSTTKLAPRTVRYALKRLVSQGVVARVPNLSDLRQTLFMLHIQRGMNR